MPNQIASKMEIRMDPDVKRVLEFMESNIAADKLLNVACAVNELATPLWSRYINEINVHARKFIPIALRPIQMHGMED